MATLTAGEQIAAEVGARIRARTSFLWIVTPEGRRPRNALIEIAAANRCGVRRWSCVSGITNGAGEPVAEDGSELPGVKAALPPLKVLAEIKAATTRNVWILEDYHAFLNDPIVRRALRETAEALQTPRVVEQVVNGQTVRVALAQIIAITTPSAEVPPDLRDLAVTIRWPLPDRVEIGRIYDAVVSAQPDAVRDKVKADGNRDAAIDAAIGLSAEAARATFQRSLVTEDKRIVPSVVAAEKKRVISETKGLEWHDPDPRGMDAVGGLDVLKSYLRQRLRGFTPEARAYGLPTPKGFLCIGPPGTGKSLVCKAVSAAWGFPLIRLDLPGMKGGIVGQSEENIRRALAIVEAVGNCIVWIDEIDKAISPAGSQDGGVSSDQLGALLTWMQDRKGGAFVVATANDVSRLPPELLRKGRFDETFVVDLPTRSERIAIFRVALAKFGRNPERFDLGGLADATADFAGSEIASVVESAMFAAFADDGREPTATDLHEAARVTVPQSKTAAEQIARLREWARARARPASTPDAPASASSSAQHGAGAIDFTDLSS